MSGVWRLRTALSMVAWLIALPAVVSDATAAAAASAVVLNGVPWTAANGELSTRVGSTDLRASIDIYPSRVLCVQALAGAPLSPRPAFLPDEYAGAWPIERKNGEQGVRACAERGARRMVLDASWKGPIDGAAGAALRTLLREFATQSERLPSSPQSLPLFEPAIGVLPMSEETGFWKFTQGDPATDGDRKHRALLSLAWPQDVMVMASLLHGTVSQDCASASNPARELSRPDWVPVPLHVYALKPLIVCSQLKDGTPLIVQLFTEAPINASHPRFPQVKEWLSRLVLLGNTDVKAAAGMDRKETEERARQAQAEVARQKSEREAAQAAQRDADALARVIQQAANSEGQASARALARVEARWKASGVGYDLMRRLPADREAALISEALAAIPRYEQTLRRMDATADRLQSLEAIKQAASLPGCRPGQVPDCMPLLTAASTAKYTDDDTGILTRNLGEVECHAHRVPLACKEAGNYIRNDAVPILQSRARQLAYLTLSCAAPGELPAGWFHRCYSPLSGVLKWEYGPPDLVLASDLVVLTCVRETPDDCRLAQNALQDARKDAEARARKASPGQLALTDADSARYSEAYLEHSNRARKSTGTTALLEAYLAYIAAVRTENVNWITDASFEISMNRRQTNLPDRSYDDVGAWLRGEMAATSKSGDAVLQSRLEAAIQREKSGGVEPPASQSPRSAASSSPPPKPPAAASASPEARTLRIAEAMITHYRSTGLRVSVQSGAFVIDANYEFAGTLEQANDEMEAVTALVCGHSEWSSAMSVRLKFRTPAGKPLANRTVGGATCSVRKGDAAFQRLKGP